MKKAGVALLLFLVLSISLVAAETNTTNITSTANDVQANLSKLERGYTCLDSKVTSCSSLSVTEISFILLSNPSSKLATDCKSALTAKKDSQNCWPNGGCKIKDTALAILALNNLGEDTTASENWLLAKTRIPTEIDWYLEQDSNSASQCKISYSGNDYTINVGDNKKIDDDAGSCLDRAQSNFWLLVQPSCYDKDFTVSCDKDFIATLLYKYYDSDTVYVSSDTKSSSSMGSVSLKINAKCFGLSSCDYEGSAWATLALLKTGNDVSSFIPYVIAVSDINQDVLPSAFLYMSTGFEDYGSKLVQEQRLGNFWEADSSRYGKFYDTALALLALKQSSTNQVSKAKLWLDFSQDTATGCWKSSNEVRDTAMILWALTDRQSTITPSSQDCESANFFCVSAPACASTNQLTNYACSGLQVCCRSSELKACEEYSGQVCSSGKTCTGNEIKASDTSSCCLADCEVPVVQNECEAEDYICRDSCSENQEDNGLSCDSSSKVCCQAKTTEESGSSWVVWLLIFGILIVLALILFLMRDRIKLWWFNYKNKVKKSPPRSGPPTTRPGFPPSRPFPPMPMRPLPVRTIPSGSKPSPRPMPGKSDDGTFKKLREMSK